LENYNFDGLLVSAIRGSKYHEFVAWAFWSHRFSSSTGFLVAQAFQPVEKQPGTGFPACGEAARHRLSSLWETGRGRLESLSHQNQYLFFDCQSSPLKGV